MYREYYDLNLTFGAPSVAGHTLTIQGLGGEGFGVLTALAHDSATQLLLERLQRLDVDASALVAIGQMLFRAAIQGTVKDIYYRSQSLLREGQHLRLRLAFDPAAEELATLPWEFLSDPDGGPLVLLDVPLVRFVQRAAALPERQVSMPLKVLLTGVQTMAGADVAHELHEVEKGLAGFGTNIQVSIEPHLTVSKLQRLAGEGFHIWHFVGRGGFSNDDRSSNIYLENETGDAVAYDAREIGILLHDSCMRLIVFHACDSAQLATEPFHALARMLVRSHVATVVITQFTRSAEATLAFTHEFYRGLAEGFPVDVCVGEGRKAVMRGIGLKCPDWGIPVVYTCMLDDRLSKQQIVVSNGQSPERRRDETSEHPGRFEAAMPQTTRIKEETQVWVMISLIDSEGLRALLPDYTKAGDEIRKQDVEDNPISLEFPVDPATNRLQPFDLFIAIRAQRFTVDRPSQRVHISPLHGSGKIIFRLTPLEPRQRSRVVIDLYKDERLDVSLGSLSLTTEVVAEYTVLGKIVWGWFVASFSLLLVARGAPNVINNYYFPGSQSVNTGGGAFVGGGVSSDGDSNIGNTSVQGDLVHGDKVAGDKVLGDKITVGRITGSSGVAIGRGASATVTGGLSASDAAQLFNAIYASIETRPADPNVDKDVIKETVQKIQQEASAGEQANESKLGRWLKFLGGIAPDIFDVTVATLTSPVAGFGMIAKKIAARAKAQQGGRTATNS